MLAQFTQARFSRDTQLLTVATGVFAVTFRGIQTLAKTLYILRLGYGLEYLGIFGARPAAQSSQSNQGQAATPFPVWRIGLLVAHVYLAQVGIAVCQTFCSAYMDSDRRLSTALIGLITGAGQFAGVLSPLAAQWGYGRLFLLAVGLSLLGALVIWAMRRDPAVVASRVRGYTITD